MLKIFGLFGAFLGLSVPAIFIFWGAFWQLADNGFLTELQIVIGIALILIGVIPGFLIGRKTGKFFVNAGLDTLRMRMAASALASVFIFTLLSYYGMILLNLNQYQEDQCDHKSIMKAMAAPDSNISLEQPSNSHNVRLHLKLKGLRTGNYRETFYPGLMEETVPADLIQKREILISAFPYETVFEIANDKFPELLKAALDNVIMTDGCKEIPLNYKIEPIITSDEIKAFAQGAIDAKDARITYGMESLIACPDGTLKIGH